MRQLGVQKTVAPPKRDDMPPTPGIETTPPPTLLPAFFHRSPIALYDLTAPIPASSSHAHWTPFSKYDCEALEQGYQELLSRQPAEKPLAETVTPQPSETKSGPSDHTEDSQLASPLVGIERLHDVDLQTWTMKPVYWSSRNASATQTPVCRGTWFYAADSMPVLDPLAESLEKGFFEVKPWTQAYEAELESASEIGESAEAKLKYNVDGDTGQYIIYRDGKTAWIGSRTIGSRLVKSLYGTIGLSRKDSFVEVYRGYDFSKTHGIKRSRDRSPNPDTTRKVSESSTTKPEKLRDIQGEEAGDEAEDGIPRPKEVTDLILVIHGIGQKLAETSEGWTFTHAVNKLRLLIHEQLVHKDVTSTLREGFVPQVLPINWRVNFDPDAPPARDTKQDEATEMFSLDDITIDAIPAVRDLIGKVVFDIPYYMSHHKPRMIAAVVKEANRIYALWKQNNSQFVANGGRVHIVCHSLGSAISFDILSHQPNDVNATPSLYDSISRKWSGEAAHKEHERSNFFDFNTNNLICAGSPAAFFLLLKQHHLIPRRNLKPEEANSKDEQITATRGTYGSLAAKQIYNVFYATDPIAYRMNATIDSGLGKILPPTQIPSNAAPFFSSLKMPFTSQTSAHVGSSINPDKVERPELRNLPSQVELEEHDFTRESLADSRLHLLNENQTLDYVLPSTSYMEHQYLSMIYAHQGYWESKEFARLIVIECGRAPGHTIIGMRGIKKSAIVTENLKKLPPK